MIEKYLTYQREQERSKATLQKYKHDLYALMNFQQDSKLTKILLISWKEKLIGEYAPASVNAMLAAVNGYLCFICPDWRISFGIQIWLLREFILQRVEGSMQDRWSG